MAWEQQYAPTLPELAAKADIIVVLGGGLQGASKPERPTPDLGEAADRMWAGAKLYNAGKAPKVLLTGGSQPWNGLTTSEADGMADLMISFGVAKDDLILEDQSQNTYENAVLSKPFLTELEAQSALLVTSAFHMQRSLAVFEKAMPSFNGSPTAPIYKPFSAHPRSSNGYRKSQHFVKARLTCANASASGSMAGATICN